MPITVVLAAAAVAVSLPLLWWSVAAARGSSTRVDPALLSGGAPPIDLRDATLRRSATDRAVRPLLASLAVAVRRVTPYGRIEALDRRLTLAGRPVSWPLERVLAAKLLLGALACLLGAFLFFDRRTGFWLLVWGAASALGYFTPDALIYSRGEERQDEIAKSLPDTLDQMTISVEAGLGFEAAMARAGRHGHGPLAQELTRTLQAIQAGVPRTSAIRELADRTSSQDLRSFVLAVLQAESYGIPIADVLRTQAAEQRVKRRQRAEEHAMKIPVKIVFPVLLCIMPTLFIVILGPAVIQIVRLFT